jgi:hypothetical protein
MVTIAKTICLLAMVGALSACAVGKGMKLAVHCQTDEALATLSEAEKGSGLTAQLAILEHEAVLREAGRTKEAEAVRAKRESRPGVSEKDKAEAEKAILDTVENIRKEREKETGSPLCK